MKNYLIFAVLYLTVLPALALNPQDQGVYALVDNQGNVTTKIARLSLSDGQWHLEDRLPDGSWQDVTCGEICTLKVSTPADVQEFTKDSALAGKALSCVHNTAFAFCGDASVSYHMLAFSNGQVIPLPWVRLNPDTLHPAGAP